jgi:5-methylcytosine-specific restriction endonuclease McrA
MHLNAGMEHQIDPKGAEAPRSLTYTAYISSHAWRASTARLTELVASGFRCRICNRGREEVRLEVHHRTYRNFGCELMSDLTTLCADCHVGNTDMLRRRRYAVHLPVSADVPATERGAPLFDPMAPGESS